MGTRSYIGEALPGGGVRAAYCHWDGYPEHNGKLLRDHYGDPQRVSALLDLGDLSSLAESPGERHPFDQRVNGWCTAYGRDRGEDETESAVHSDEEAFMDAAGRRGCEWAYLWDGVRWRCWQVDDSREEVDLYSRDSPLWGQ